MQGAVVHWDYTLSSVEPTSSKTYDLHFKNGQVARRYDLVVGADGTWSRVRPLVTSVVPFYSGLSFIETDIPRPQGPKYDSVNALIGRGTIFVCATDQGMYAQRLKDGSIRVYTMFITESSEWVGRFIQDSSEQERAKILDKLEGWAPMFLEVLRLTEGPLAPRPLYMFPVDHKWEARLGVTLIGDAGHVMTPAAGE